MTIGPGGARAPRTGPWPAGAPVRSVGRPAHGVVVGPAAPSLPRAEPVGGALTTTATGHRATVTRCRCGLPAGGDGFDAGSDPEPLDVRSVTVLGQVPGVTRWDRAADGLWYPARTRYQAGSTPLPWSALGLCADGRRHRVVAVG